MRKIIPLLAIVLALSAAALRADFQTGLEAYNRGDFAAALKEWQPLADNGDANAQYNMGLLYARGQGVAQDYAKAAEWYRKAAEQGVAAAQFNLGVIYANGQGVPQDVTEAQKWFQKAAQAGVAEAEDSLGTIYGAGQGVPKNFAEAEKFYRRAAERGVASAQYNLAVIYDLGQGTERNYEEALKWYRKAADQGYASALCNIGILYYNAQGVKRDLVESYAWISRCENAGDSRGPQLRRILESRMKPDDIRKAQQLAASWKPSGPVQVAQNEQLFAPRPEGAKVETAAPTADRSRTAAASALTAPATPSPGSQPATQPAAQPTVETASTATPAPQPAAPPATASTTAPLPAAQPTTGTAPAATPAPQPVAQPATASTTAPQPAAQPTTGTALAATPAPQPAAQPVTASTTAPQPTIQPTTTAPASTVTPQPAPQPATQPTATSPASTPPAAAEPVPAATTTPAAGTPNTQHPTPNTQPRQFLWPAAERVVAVGDVHGDFEQFFTVLESANLVDGNGDWIGGKAHLVQTGDIVDRGPDSRRVMDLLLKLEKQAAAAGGGVHCLIGNHEAMNVYGDLRYVSPGEFAAFRTESSEAARDVSYEQFRKAMVAVAKPDLDRENWNREHPPGFLEHRQAFSLNGTYGQWIAGHNAIIKIGRTVYVHGGISPKYAGWSMERINNEVHAELTNLAALHGGIVVDEQGPLWYSGLAKGDESQLAPVVDRVLQAYDADRIVIGHTYADAAITPRFGGKVLMIDIGLSRIYDNIGKLGCLVIENGKAYALHRGQKLELPKDSGPDMLRYLRQAAALDPAPSPLTARITALESKVAPRP